MAAGCLKSENNPTTTAQTSKRNKQTTNKQPNKQTTKQTNTQTNNVEEPRFEINAR
jgi:hypothetical protein